MFWYRLAGLTVASEIELRAAPSDCTEVDAIVRLGSVPGRLENPIARGAGWEADPRQLLMQLPGIGRFHAVDGKSIAVEPCAHLTDLELAPFVLSACLAALLYQRGRTLVRASAVSFRGRTHLFCGFSGVGKSTLAAALCRVGCELVCDDLAVLELDINAKPVVISEGRPSQVFESSLAPLGNGSCAIGPVRPSLRGDGRQYVDVPGWSRPQSYPLGEIFVLREHQTAASATIEQLSPVDGAQAILNEAFLPRLAQALASPSASFAVAAAVIRKTAVILLHRPPGFEHLSATIDTLMSRWSMPGDSDGRNRPIMV